MAWTDWVTQAVAAVGAVSSTALSYQTQKADLATKKAQLAAANLALQPHSPAPYVGQTVAAPPSGGLGGVSNTVLMAGVAIVALIAAFIFMRKG